MRSHSSPVDVNNSLGRLSYDMTPDLEDKVPAVASIWHDLVDRRSSSSQI